MILIITLGIDIYIYYLLFSENKHYNKTTLPFCAMQQTDMAHFTVYKMYYLLSVMCHTISCIPKIEGVVVHPQSILCQFSTPVNIPSILLKVSMKKAHYLGLTAAGLAIS